MDTRCKLSRTLVFLFLVAPLSSARSQSCTLPESAFEGNPSGRVAWMCRQKEPPCQPMATLLTSPPLRVDVKNGVRGIARRCDPSREEGGAFFLFDPESSPRLKSPQIVRGKGGRRGRYTVSCVKDAEYLGYVPLGTARLDLLPGEAIEIVQQKDGFTELRLARPIRIVPGEAKGSSGSVTTTIGIVGTENALRIAALGEWDEGWGKESIDARIEREILWFALGTEDVPSIQRKAPATSFGMLALESSKAPVERLGDKPVLQSLARFLEGYPVENLDYLILLKEGWDPALTGIELLEKQLARLPADAHFDIVSAKTVTSENGFLRSLAERRDGGRYFESATSDRFEIPGQDLGERVRGKIRARAREKAQALGIDLDPAPLARDRIVVRLADSGLEAGNLITPEHLAQMRSVLDLAVCLAEGSEETVRPGILAAMSRAGARYREEETVQALFHAWFSGFELPPESPLAEITFGKLVNQLRQPEKRAFLEKVLAGLRKLPAADAYCSIFVPHDLFLSAK